MQHKLTYWSARTPSRCLTARAFTETVSDGSAVPLAAAAAAAATSCGLCASRPQCPQTTLQAHWRRRRGEIVLRQIQGSEVNTRGDPHATSLRIRLRRRSGRRQHSPSSPYICIRSLCHLCCFFTTLNSISCLSHPRWFSSVPIPTTRAMERHPPPLKPAAAPRSRYVTCVLPTSFCLEDSQANYVRCQALANGKVS